MIKRFLQILLLLLSISLVNLSAATIKGRVIDSNTHETIIGATVLVENQKYYAVSDANGNYSIAGLAEGKYMLFVKSLGYITSYSQEIEVKNGQDVISYDFYLKHDEVSLSEVEVSGNASRTTDLSARNSERNADNIINVMSAKSIELSPDMTVANVIGRMSGVTIERDNTGDGQYAILRGMDKRFNYTMVNGVKIPSPDNKNRFVPLDIFP
ncbi:MAG TPA: TonB-dependent receptor, partial [Bacteroidales bacterium]